MYINTFICITTIWQFLLVGWIIIGMVEREYGGYDSFPRGWVEAASFFVSCAGRLLKQFQGGLRKSALGPQDVSPDQLKAGSIDGFTPTGNTVVLAALMLCDQGRACFRRFNLAQDAYLYLRFAFPAFFVCLLFRLRRACSVVVLLFLVLVVFDW